MKNSTTVFAAVILLMLAACGSEESGWYELTGKTMGSTYHIQYQGTKDYQRDIDRLLEGINSAVSTYDENSVISKFNKSGRYEIPLEDSGVPKSRIDGHFFAILDEAHGMFEMSHGYFDPTVGPLVDVWGFGKEGHQKAIPDSGVIQNLLQNVGMQHVSAVARNDTFLITSERPGLTLNFNALTAGYACDKVYELLNAAQVKDAFIEITGEIRVMGNSPRGDAWVAGVNVPEEGADFTAVKAKIRLHDQSMATSGNYRNFYMLDGRKVWHTINPKTGYPEETNLLSATILHSHCVAADALATACMAQDVDGAIGLIREIGAQGYFIYRDRSGKITSYVTDMLAQNIIQE